MQASLLTGDMAAIFKRLESIANKWGDIAAAPTLRDEFRTVTMHLVRSRLTPFDTTF